MNTKAWYYVFMAGLLEIVWILGLKFSEGFTLLVPSTVTVITMIISFLLLSSSMKTIPIGIAYVIFTGIGTVATVIVGMIFFNEPTNIMRIMFIILLMGGILGLKMTSGEEANAPSKSN